MQLSNQGVYLENRNGNHYETVVCVKQPNLQSCYGYCKVDTSCPRLYNVRRTTRGKRRLTEQTHGTSSAGDTDCVERVM